MSTSVVLTAALLAALSGVPSLFRRPRPNGPSPETWLMGSAALLGLTGVVLAFLPGSRGAVEIPWGIAGGPFQAGVDPLSALFLGPLFLVSGAGAFYGDVYWSETLHPSWRRLRVFYGLLTGALTVVFVARNFLLFLGAWEVMALAAFFLISTEWNEPKARRAGLVYLLATHVGTLCLFGLVALLFQSTGSFAFGHLPVGLAVAGAGTAIFWLAVAGFGLKAGLMPLHFWLPGAHAAAPSHVSALMSGVMIKSGIYGLVRVQSLFPDPPRAWGETVLLLGVVSGVLGVAFALGQHDLKRLLAYHSVENIGIIAIGLGLGLVGRSLGNPAWVVLGFGGALLHVVNHGLFKSLLFLGAGSVVRASRTREMDRMGGLLRVLPISGACFLVGAVAICGLPPLNGFVSEWFLYLGLLEGIGKPAASIWPWGSLAVPALALIGALAVACFVKAFGIVFLGESRTSIPRDANEPASMWVPMATLAALCFVIGLVPMLVTPILDQAIAISAAAQVPGARLPLPPLAAAAALRPLSAFLIGLALVLLASAIAVRRLTRDAKRDVTWGCGYASPGPTMQYTSSSFAGWTVGLFRWALLPVTPANRLSRPFAKPFRFASHVNDAVLHRLLIPVFQAGAKLAGWGRRVQQGQIQIYLFYVALTIVILLFQV
ncbi:MAG TPA: proton-conducting transporter membrane subunit [Thermoanaerobaculia bacterium]